MPWDAKLDWAEEVYTLLVVLPVPVVVVAALACLAPWLHRRSLERARRGHRPIAPQAVSEIPAGERT